MKRPPTRECANLALSAIAGLAGTAVMIAMRSFDERYAPATIGRTRQDPGDFLVKKMEAVLGLKGRIPQSVEKTSAFMMHLGYGALGGILCAVFRKWERNKSALLEGSVIGTAVYGLGYAGWLPLLRLSRPLWKQPASQIAGELMRHVAYGVTTAVVYGGLNSILDNGHAGRKATA